ncbi:YybH family protein [Chryseobacterium paridis]|uniref:DUF4440 domain-containing protein n=1 Tax=Chryseobacterium paridis TaxID=2800328 RepID=A0ABS1FUS4_9FLAO|nr:ketosteroid isomerase family protein [Chryseobacterium paridis]MBK1896168.1 hypothetical protein [Chryseobacterium paridis]
MKKILIISGLIASVCFCKAQNTDIELENVRKVIELSNANYADLANKGDGSILTKYTEDACLFPPGSAPVCGHEHISSFFKGSPKVKVKFTIQHLYGDPKTCITEESFYEMTDPEGKKMDDGKVIVIWKNTKNGWKMHRDMFSSNHPMK